MIPSILHTRESFTSRKKHNIEINTMEMRIEGNRSRIRNESITEKLKQELISNQITRGQGN